MGDKLESSAELSILKMHSRHFDMSFVN